MKVKVGSPLKLQRALQRADPASPLGAYLGSPASGLELTEDMNIESDGGSGNAGRLLNIRSIRMQLDNANVSPWHFYEKRRVVDEYVEGRWTSKAVVVAVRVVMPSLSDEDYIQCMTQNSVVISIPPGCDYLRIRKI